MMAGALIVSGGASEARVSRIEVLSTDPAFAGASFGDVGTYDRLAVSDASPNASYRALMNRKQSRGSSRN
jgi:hypothetical protein